MKKYATIFFFLSSCAMQDSQKIKIVEQDLQRSKIAIKISAYIKKNKSSIQNFANDELVASNVKEIFNKMIITKGPRDLLNGDFKFTRFSFEPANYEVLSFFPLARTFSQR